jgi:polar amino acid transport system ATP-binding protein
MARNHGDALLVAEGIEKSFPGTGEVLRGISFSLNAGEVKVIIGPSGSGKSTLLRCINLLTVPDKGRVFLDRIQIRDENKYIARQQIGFVFQHFNLFAHLTALENVTIGPKTVKGTKDSTARKIGEEYLEKVGLINKKDAYPAELSGGQQQRVGIARALAMEPKLILLDEPTSALDPELIGEVLVVLKDLTKDGLTMLVVSHEMEFAQAVAKEIIFMEKGKIIEQGPPTQFSNPQFERTRQFLRKINELREDHT